MSEEPSRTHDDNEGKLVTEQVELQVISVPEATQIAIEDSQVNGGGNEINDTIDPSGYSEGQQMCQCRSRECWMTPFTRKFWLSASTSEVDWKFWATYYMGIIPKLFLMLLNFYDLYFYASIQDWRYFCILFAAMLIPVIPINLFSYWWCSTDSRPVTVPRSIKALHWCLLGYWWRQYRLQLQAKKVARSSSADARHRFSLLRADLTFLSLMAVYASSAPQLVFKLYRLVERWKLHANTDYQLPVIGSTGIPQADLKIVFAVLTGFSLAFSTISHAHASRQHRWDKLELSNASRCLQVFYRLFFLTSRVVALACLFLLGTPAAWGICIALCFLMLVWFRWLATEFCEFPYQEWIYNVVLSYMHLFGVFNVKDTPARYRYLLYYTFSGLLEATVFICAVTSGKGSPWLLLFMVAFVLGLVCHGLEHAVFHPPAADEQLSARRWYIAREREPWENECQHCLQDKERAAPEPTVTGAEAA